MASAGLKIRASDIPVRVGCRLRRAANQVVASATPTTISWDTEDEDTAGSPGFITVTGTTITIPAGKSDGYAITVRAAGAIGGGRAYLEIVPTSAITGIPAAFRVVIDSTEDQATVTATLPLNAGDTFVCNVYHSTGSNVNFTAWLSCYATSP